MLGETVAPISPALLFSSMEITRHAEHGSTEVNHKPTYIGGNHSTQLELTLTIDLLQFLDVVEYSAVENDEQRKDNEVVGCYDCSVDNTQLPQLSSVLAQ